MLYCSYYGNVPNILKNGFKPDKLISISLSQRYNFYTEKRFCVRDIDFINYRYGHIYWDEYVQNYYDKLYNLEKIWLDNVFELYDGCVFLCFEKNPSQCHRSLLAKFLNWYYNNCKGFNKSELGSGVICKELVL